MQKKQIFKMLLGTLLVAATLFTACKKEENSPVSRDVKYEITGNFSGDLSIAYTAANGSFETITVNKLPWTLAFTANASTTSLSASAIGTSGKGGQTAVFKIYVGGKEVESGAGTATNIGSISLTPKTYLFPR